MGESVSNCQPHLTMYSFVFLAMMATVWLLPSRSLTFMRRFQLSHIFIKKLLLNLMSIRNLHYLQKLLEMLPMLPPLFLLDMLLVQSGLELVSTTWDNLFHADSESWCYVGKRQIPFIGLASLDSLLFV